ncbi:sarcosine oxidase subunit gamma family protein [Gordonia sp. CPCC 205515]|uniref:sarcosine oxidase subunit gamma n=1 Tax=Gordonia sp. CPCC 205515 TaxID=3140791 RepID=UPI003AF3E894
MADTLIRRSPLQAWTSRLSQLPESVSITEEPFVTMVDLWVDPAGPAGTSAAAVLGITALPTTPGTVVEGSESSVIWFGPEEFLVTGAGLDGESLETRLREAISEQGGAAVDVSAQRTVVRLRGEHARAILAKGCSLDLHPSVFTLGSATQTMLGLAGVVLIPVTDDGTDYRIIVRSSFAGYLADWLIDASEEYGVRW